MANPYALDLRIPQHLLNGYTKVSATNEKQVDYHRLYNDLINGTTINQYTYFALGVMSICGLGCEKNEADAYHYFEQAFIAGSSLPAAFNLYRLTLLKVGCKEQFGETSRNGIAFKYLKFAADNGYYYGQLYYGNALRSGDEQLGVSKDLSAARAVYKKGCGSTEGTTCALNYAQMCEKGEGGPVDYDEAKIWYLAISDTNGSAAHNLGAMYYNGRGVKQDYFGALVNFKNAADLGNVVSMINVGNMYAWGLGDDRNDEIAIEYYVKAIRAGWKNDDFLSLLKKGHIDEERLAALYPDVISYITELGLDYYFGRKNLPQDYSKAFPILELSARHGDAKAILYVIQCYRLGEGTPKDEKKAFQMLRHLEQYGPELKNNEMHRFFYFQMGECYYYGQGTEENKAEGIKYFRKGADLGDLYAKIRLMPCYADGKNGAEQNIPLAMQYANDVIKLTRNTEDRAYGYYVLGYCYSHGDKTIRDYEKALENCKKSVELNPQYESASKLLGQLSYDGKALKPTSDLMAVFEETAGNVFGSIFGAIVGGLLGAGSDD